MFNRKDDTLGILILALLCAVTFMACETASVSEPETTITLGPTDGATLDASDVTFQWVGDVWVVEYSYQLDDGPWSEWNPSASVTLTPLPEGIHTFAVKGRYANGAEDPSPAIRTFRINSVRGPTLLIRPAQIEATVASTFTVDVVAAEVSDTMLAHLFVSYDPSYLQLIRVETDWPNSLLKQTGGTIISDHDTSRPGMIEMSLGVGIGIPPGASGTGSLARITFAVLREGMSELSIAGNSELRDSHNLTIQLQETRGSTVTALPTATP